MYIHWYDSAVRLTGRWSRNDRNCTTASAPGAYFELAFTGPMLKMEFDMGLNHTPVPHLWVSVDAGAEIEVPLDWFLRVSAGEGSHIVKVTLKSEIEVASRWYPVLDSCVRFKGAEADGAGALPRDDRRLIEFIGDSITEGVLIDADFTDNKPYPVDQMNRPFQDDNSATYAALLARALNLRPMFQAYGAVGVTKPGCACVPPAEEIYDYVYFNVPYEGEKPDIIMINHGTNDYGAGAERYLERYAALLDHIREKNPQAVIIALGVFLGTFSDELGEMIRAYNEKNHCRVHFIATKGLLPAQPVHPLRDGHRIVAEYLIPRVKEIIG